MSTHRAGPSGSTYYAASHRARPRPRPNPVPGPPTEMEDPGAEPGYTVPGQRRRRRAGPVPARPARKTPIVIGVLAVVVVLCIGGGAAGYFLLAGDTSGERPAALEAPSVFDPTSATPSAAPPPAATPSATKQPKGGEEEVSGDLSALKQGDCLTVDESNDNRVEKAGCTDPGAQKVLLRKAGTLDDSVCQTVNATYSLSQDASGSAKDFVLCVGPAR